MANCKECHAAAHLRWRTENPETWKSAKAKAQRDYTLRKRVQAIDYLGGACSRCGQDDKRVLEIDHINGGGTLESRAIGNTAIHRKILRGESGYQVLCANCHSIKTWHDA